MVATIPPLRAGSVVRGDERGVLVDFKMEEIATVRLREDAPRAHDFWRVAGGLQQREKRLLGRGLLRDGVCGNERQGKRGQSQFEKKRLDFHRRDPRASGRCEESLGKSENGKLMKSLGNQTNLEEKFRREPRGRRQMGHYRWSAVRRG